MTPQTYAVVAVGTATAMTALAQITQRRTPGARLIVGGTLAAAMLSAAGGLAPELVRGLSTVIILASLLGAGYVLTRPLLAIINR